MGAQQPVCVWTQEYLISKVLALPGLSSLDEVIWSLLYAALSGVQGLC